MLIVGIKNILSCNKLNIVDYNIVEDWTPNLKHRHRKHMEKHYENTVQDLVENIPINVVEGS